MSKPEGQAMSGVLEIKDRLRWFGHVLWMDSEYIGRRMRRVELPGWRPRRPKRRFMNLWM